MIRPTQNQVNEARAVLKAAGFYIDNLWSVWDVYANYPTASEEQAQDILDKSLTNDETMNQIWFSIDSAAENENLERIEVTI